MRALWACLLLTACQTGLPVGYGPALSVKADLDIVTIAQARLWGPGTITTPPAPVIAAVGQAGAAQYWADAASPQRPWAAGGKQDALRDAERAMGQQARANGYKNDAAFAADVRATLGVTGTDAEVITGLLTAAIRAVPK